MRRFLISSILLVGLVLVSPLFPVSASGTGGSVNMTPAESSLSTLAHTQKKNMGPCNSPRFEVKPSMGGEKVRRRMVALIACAIEKWPVQGGLQKALDVAYCESGDNLWPWSFYDEPGDGAPFGCAGVFQQNTKYWVERVHQFLRPNWFTKDEWNRLLTVKGAYNARANVLVSIQMAHRGGWGPWSCA